MIQLVEVRGLCEPGVYSGVCECVKTHILVVGSSPVCVVCFDVLFVVV